MPQKTLFLNDPSWRSLTPNPTPVAVHWLQNEAVEHLIVEAPNWANAWEWGEQAARMAYAELLAAGESPLNPCDESGLQVWVVVPGFPVDSKRLWTECFNRYASIARNASRVVAVVPGPGTAGAKPGAMLGLDEALSLWGPGFTLLHVSAYATLVPRPAATPT